MSTHPHLELIPRPVVPVRGEADREVRVGEVALADEGRPLRVRRLGSAVAVCAHAPDIGLVGIAVVSRPGGRGAIGAGARLACEADVGVALLVARMRAAGAQAIHADLVGGGRLLGATSALDLGARVARACCEALRAEGLGCRRRLLGGASARDLALHPDGTLLVDGVVLGEAPP